MERQAALAALTLLAAACAAPRAPGGGGASLEVSTAFPEDLKLREGALAAVSFRLRNGSDRYLLLRDLTLTGAPGAVVTWQFSQPGEFRYDADRDEWSHRRGDPDRAQLLLNSGLLAPTESVTVRARIRLLHLPKDFRLRYEELTRADIAEKVYFEHRFAREVRYRRRVGRDLDLKLVPEPKTDAGGHRVVLFPFAEQVNPSSKVKTIRVDASVEPRAFSLLQATQKARLAAPEEVAYSTAYEAWVLRSGRQTALVNETRNFPLPPVRQLDRLFHYIDSLGKGKAEIEFLRETKTLFADKYTLVHDPKGARYLAFLTPAELLPFFKDVREAGLEVDAEIRPDGGGRILVTKP